MDQFRKNSQTIIKTIADYSVSILALIFSSPVLLILAISIKVYDGGPVIYSQKRIGRSGKHFTLYKLRSMKNDTEGNTHLLSGKNDRRITPPGHFMRKHKLDEIPNFINVLKGEMSIVGPRPEQQCFVDKILLVAPQYKLLQNIKPGITSWGQVRFGYASNVGEMIERLDYDLYYLNNRSMFFDIKVIFFTIGIILKGEGV